MSVPATYKNKKVWTPPVREGYGTIGVITSERGTYTSFWNDLNNVHLTMLMDDHRNQLNIRMGVDICGALNSLIRNLRGDWLWIMGDDHAFAPDILLRLIAHDVDVVVPNCLRRNPPWDPVVNSHQNEDGWHVMALDLPEDELTEVWSAGSAGMLIRRHVFEAIADPWFVPSPDAVGLNEDLNFCRLAREAGFKIYCDPGALLGHIANYTVYPEFRDGRWQMAHVFDQQTRFPVTRFLEEVPN